MKTIGLLLITVGTVLGSLAGSFSADTVSWPMFVPGLVLGILGVVLAQWAIRREKTDTSTLSAHIQDIESSLAALAKGVTELDHDKSDDAVYELPGRIETELYPHLETFVDARESMIPLFGLQAYADVMGLFAGGERYLNRVWSSAAEGYVDEAHRSLAKARTYLTSANEAVQALRTTSHG